MADFYIQLLAGVLYVEGRLVRETVQAVWNTSKPLLSTLPKYSIDLGDVSKSDSATLALLLEWYRYAKLQEKPIEFLRVPRILLNIAKLSDLDEVLPLKE